MWGDLEERFSTSYDFSHFFDVCRDKKCASDDVNGFFGKNPKIDDLGGQRSGVGPGARCQK